jgi:hypothetical protein
MWPLIFSQKSHLPGSAYWLLDYFATNRAAGTIDGTQAEPVGGARTVRDSLGTKLSISDRLLRFASGGVTGGDPGIYWPLQSRVSGKALTAKIIASTNAIRGEIGWDPNGTGTPDSGIVFSTSGNIIVRITTALSAIVGAYTAGTYRAMIVMRPAGFHYLIQGEAFSYWRLLYSSINSSADRSPYITVGASNAQAFDVEKLTLFKVLQILTPKVSDGFSGVLTDGAGNAENNGPIGAAWTNRIGTVGRSGGAAIATALVGGIAIATLPAGTPNINLAAALSRVTTGVGLVMRYVDADNYVYIKRIAANIVVVKRIAGVETTLIDLAMTESAGGRLFVSIVGSELRVAYNDASVGTLQTVSDAGISASGEMGLIFFDLDSTADNFVAWAAGVEGQYEHLWSAT